MYTLWENEAQMIKGENGRKRAMNPRENLLYDSRPPQAVVVQQAKLSATGTLILTPRAMICWLQSDLPETVKKAWQVGNWRDQIRHRVGSDKGE